MKIQWHGDQPTRVTVEHGADKVELNKGDTFEVPDIKGEEFLKYSKDFQVVTGAVKPEQIEKAMKKEK